VDLLRSLPIGLYLEQPITWLHRLDPRIKLGWLLSFLLAPIWANAWWRIFLVALLIAISVAARIPWRALKQQMGWLLLIGCLIFVVAMFSPDSTAASQQPRLPIDRSLSLPQAYQYVLFEFKSGWIDLAITRKSLDLATSASTLLFTLVYSTSVYLLTTAPEEITAGLEDIMSPLRRYGVPVTELALTLTLSLRFIPLVLEEIQNLVRSIYTRAIDWQKLGMKNSLKVWLTVAEKLILNLLVRSEQIAVAMQARGFTTPNTHKVEWHQLQFHRGDAIAVIILLIFWVCRYFFGEDVRVI
jgi:energy-coupling factor transport system permease protein